MWLLINLYVLEFGVVFSVGSLHRVDVDGYNVDIILICIFDLKVRRNNYGIF